MIELPNLEEYGELINKISEYSSLVSAKEILIKIKEAEIVQEAISNIKYFQNNKPPSQSFIDSTFKYTGFEGELIPLRKELGDLEAKLEYYKLRYRYLSTLIEIWRTQEANNRVLSS